MSNSGVYFKSKEELVPFVNDLLNAGKLDWLSITITNQEKSGDYCVRIVTVGSLAGTVRRWVQTYFKQHMNTSSETTPAG